MKDLNELNIPPELKYAKDHEWVSPQAPFRIGVSDFAQDQLGDLTFVELPEVGKVIETGGEFGSIESIKSVSTLYLPIGGTIAAVNEALQNDPGLINRDPYGEGWIVEITPADNNPFAALMDGATYAQHLSENA